MNPNELKERFEKSIAYFLISLTLLGFGIGIYFSIIELDSPEKVNLYLILPFLFFLFPYILLSMYKLHISALKLNAIPRFLRDVVDNIEGGMDFLSAIHSGVKN